MLGPRYKAETELDCDPDNGENNWCLEFHCSRMNPLQIDVPLFHVNQEARRSILSWIHDQGLALRFCRKKQSLVFIRSFDPKRDLLYVPENRWYDFQVEPFDPGEEPDLESPLLCRSGYPPSCCAQRTVYEAA
jgi:hypothetical protein